MTPNEFINHCLSKKGAWIDYPFGPDVTIIKVQKRIFAQIFKLKDIDTITLNCEEMTGQFYRSLFPGVVVRGYHCPKVQQPYFNSMPIGGIDDNMLLEMLDHSYKTVVGKLPKYVQRELEEG